MGYRKYLRLITSCNASRRRKHSFGRSRGFSRLLPLRAFLSPVYSSVVIGHNINYNETKWRYKKMKAKRQYCCFLLAMLLSIMLSSCSRPPAAGTEETGVSLTSPESASETEAVSYTHLDVYKRQSSHFFWKPAG